MYKIYFDETASAELRSLAAPFGLTVIDRQPEEGSFLIADESGISLCRAGEKGRVRVDFDGGAAHYRRTKGGGELIAKAVNHTAQPTVWDATGGLGRDSFVLASLGLNVHTFEQNPAVACLLSDGLNRAGQSEETREIARRITLHFGNAVDLMQELSAQNGRPDVVYLDPMYPERRKTAAVKKEMAYFPRLGRRGTRRSRVVGRSVEYCQKAHCRQTPALGRISRRAQTCLSIHRQKHAV